MANIDKYKRTMCRPGTVRTGMSEESVGQRSMGKKNYLLGEDTAEAAVPRLRVGVDSGVDNVPPQVPACNIAVNQLGQANC